MARVIANWSLSQHKKPIIRPFMSVGPNAAGSVTATPFLLTRLGIHILNLLEVFSFSRRIFIGRFLIVFKANSDLQEPCQSTHICINANYNIPVI